MVNQGTYCKLTPQNSTNKTTCSPLKKQIEKGPWDGFHASCDSQQLPTYRSIEALMGNAFTWCLKAFSCSLPEFPKSIVNGKVVAFHEMESLARYLSFGVPLSSWKAFLNTIGLQLRCCRNYAHVRQAVLHNPIIHNSIANQIQWPIIDFIPRWTLTKRDRHYSKLFDKDRMVRRISTSPRHSNPNLTGKKLSPSPIN